ncbi:5362_t:CDS:2, partial [Gigaspora margarita]
KVEQKGVCKTEVFGLESGKGLKGVLFQDNFERSTNLEKVVEEIKPSDQFEYDEWYKIRRFLNTTIVNKDWVLIGKIRDIAATRAFMLRVMKKEVPDSLQKISLRVDSKPEASVSSFSNLPGGQASTSI